MYNSRVSATEARLLSYTDPHRIMLIPRLLWLVPALLLTLALVLLVASEYATARASRRTKDVAYVAATAPDFDAVRHRLDVYAPRATSSALRPVVVFIHGGSWNSGSKNLYSFVGRRLAKQGVVAVVINYRLSPGVRVPDMAADCARAVDWTARHIADYGGDPNRLFTMGHSAGAGLAALLAVKDELFAGLGRSTNPVKGAILDDPAGLDMFDYLTKLEYPNDEQYLIPFGKDPAVWRAVSPMYHVRAGDPPMLLFVGGETYPSITSSSRRFHERLQALGIRHEYTTLPGKKHVGMVTQLYWKNNVIYQSLLRFVGVKP